MPHLTVGTFGPRGHGKTTLTSAITKVLARRRAVKALEIDQIDKSKDEKAFGMTIDYNVVEYATDTCHYAHLDCPGDNKYAESMLTALSQIDIGILVLSVTEGPLTAEVHKMLKTALQMGVRKVAVFLNKTDVLNDVELWDLHACEAEDALARNRIQCVGVVRNGSAIRAAEGDPDAVNAIEKLLQDLDGHAGSVERNVAAPFAMQVGRAFSVTNVGTVASGRISSGVVKPGDQVEIIGLRNPITAIVKEVRCFDTSIPEAGAGDFVALLLEGLKREDVSRGQLICTVGCWKPLTEFQVEGYLFSAAEGGRHTPIFSGFSPKFILGTADVTGEITFTDHKYITPGSNFVSRVKLAEPCRPVWERFLIRDNDITIGFGIVLDLVR